MFAIVRHNRQRQPSQEIPAKLRQAPAVSRVDWSKSVHKEESPGLKVHIYNFLITEGNFDVAQTFAKEAGLSPELLKKYQSNPQTNQQATTKRLEIKALIKDNKIDQAISKLKQYELTSRDEARQEELIFQLLCLKILQYIRDGEYQTAIIKSRTELLPLVDKNNARMDMVEKVMTYLAFSDIKQCPNSILEPKYKNSIAEEVNTYLLGKNSPESLKNIISVGRWLEKRLQSHMTFPHLNPWSNELYQK